VGIRYMLRRVSATSAARNRAMAVLRALLQQNLQPDAAHPGRRLQEVDTYSAMTRALLVMADRMAGLGITRW
jgi:hypothetical protein